jgi:hypothetical protein
MIKYTLLALAAVAACSTITSIKIVGYGYIALFATLCFVHAGTAFYHTLKTGPDDLREKLRMAERRADRLEVNFGPKLMLELIVPVTLYMGGEIGLLIYSVAAYAAMWIMARVQRYKAGLALL